MKFFSNFFSRVRVPGSERGARSARHRSGTVVLALGMLLLIIAQLSWWLIFFRRNQEETLALQMQLDRLRIAAANGELTPGPKRPGATPALESFDRNNAGTKDLTLLADGRYGLAQAELDRRERDSRRAFIMLLSESLFVIVVCSYGTFRVMRTILRERRLRHERQIFIDSVTHELKTPLASILLNLQTILKRKLSRAGHDELIQDSITDVRRLAEQLNNILLSGRLGRRSDRGGGAEASEIDCVEAIHNFFRENARRFDQAGLQQTFDLPTTLYLSVDLDAFRTILSNVLQNTIQYAGSAGPLIHIEARLDGKGAAVLFFRDQGTGIPRTEWENVFQPFYRLQEGQRPVRGSGMGLYLVRELARAAGGDVRILAPRQCDAPNNENPTNGTVIELRLPVAVPHGAKPRSVPVE